MSRLRQDWKISPSHQKFACWLYISAFFLSPGRSQEVKAFFWSCCELGQEDHGKYHEFSFWLWYGWFCVFWGCWHPFCSFFFSLEGTGLWIVKLVSLLGEGWPQAYYFAILLTWVFLLFVLFPLFHLSFLLSFFFFLQLHILSLFVLELWLKQKSGFCYCFIDPGLLFLFFQAKLSLFRMSVFHCYIFSFMYSVFSHLHRF